MQDFERKNDPLKVEECFSLSSVKQVPCPSPDQFSTGAKGARGRKTVCWMGENSPFGETRAELDRNSWNLHLWDRLTEFHLPSLWWRFCYAPCLVALLALCSAVVICLYYSNRDTVFLQGTASWPTVTPRTSMPPPVPSAFNPPTLQLYSTFRTRRAPKALHTRLECEGRSTNCHFSNYKLTFFDSFILKSCEFFL